MDDININNTDVNSSINDGIEREEYIEACVKQMLIDNPNSNEDYCRQMAEKYGL